MSENNLKREDACTQDVQKFFALSFGTIYFIAQIIGGIMKTNGFLITDLQCNLFLKLLAVLGSSILMMLIGVLLATCYMYPATIAYQKNLANKEKMKKLNIQFGWTGIIWIGILLYAFSQEKRNKFLD